MKTLSKKIKERIDTLKVFFEETKNDVLIKVREDGKIVVIGKIFIYKDKYTGFPEKFDILEGDITWCSNKYLDFDSKLNTLANFPDEIYGNCLLAENLELTSLKNAPKVVDGIFSIEGCSNIKSLKHCPETVNTLVINRTGVTDISELDKVTLKNLYAINTPLDESSFDALKNKTKIYLKS